MRCESLERRELLHGGEISGFVFVDTDQDGVKDLGEIGVPGALLTLTGTETGSAAVNQTALSQDDGSYSFEDLNPGTYALQQSQPKPFVDGQDTKGSTGATLGNDQITNIALGDEESIAGNNFGERHLKPEFVSLRLFLASTPPLSTFLRETIASSEAAAGNSALAAQIRAGATTTTPPPDPNNAPVAFIDTYSVAEEGSLNVPTGTSVLANDNDADSDPLTAQLVANVAHGTLALNANGTFTYTPTANFSGTDTFTYRASDGSLTSAVTTVTINVSAVNDAPVAASNTYAAGGNSTLNITSANGVLANDTDVDNTTLTAQLVANVAHGTLTLNADGSLSYTPTTGFVGSDSFTYRASDGALTSDVATVTINVTAANTAPVANNDSFNVNKNATLTTTVANGVLVNDTDAESNPLSAALITNVGHGTLTLNANGTFTYTPTSGFVGGDSFTYRVSDGQTTSNPATVSITVTDANQAPVAVANTYTTTGGGTLSVNAASGVLANDTDADGNPLTAQLVGNVANGVLTLGANGAFTYTPNAGFNGADTFTYRASDGTLTSNTVTVTINISNNPANALFGAATAGSFEGAGLLGTRTDLVSGAPPITANHVNGTVNYSAHSNPPTYGDHHGSDPTGTDTNPGITPRPTGIYTVAQPDEDLVHNLEHGHVWISYNPSLIGAGELALLEKLVRDGSPNANGGGVGVILTPRAGNTSMIALASWARLLTLNSYDPATIRSFIETNRGKAPEGFITP